MRVNQPAYVQLVYLLASGVRVALEQAYFTDASKVNRAIEYPSTFEVSAPFGAEQIYAVAYTQAPPPLPALRQVIDGSPYDVVADAATLVKHRGLKRKQEQKKAEAALVVTTLPKR